MENNLLKTNFTGKDGFRWWIGQIAPEKVQGDQLKGTGNAWGCRLKVRIYGYHPADLTELPDEDLPWAQILLSSQGGSGRAIASCCRNTGLQILQPQGCCSMVWLDPLHFFNALLGCGMDHA